MLSGDNSILQKATDAKTNTDNAQIREKIRLAYNSALTKDIVNQKGEVYKSTFEDELKVEFPGKTIDIEESANKKEWVVTIDEVTENVPIGKDTQSSIATLPAGTYTAGQEVEFNGEKFFVIDDDGNSVRLLAKYCLNQEGTAQTDKEATCNGDNNTVAYGKRFSQTNYWSSDFTSAPFDLQSEAMLTKLLEQTGENASNNAIITAQEYGTSKGVTGRLMTYAEANSIQNGSNSKMKNILWGKWTSTESENAPVEGYLYFWLGDAYDNSPVWCIYGVSR